MLRLFDAAPPMRESQPPFNPYPADHLPPPLVRFWYQHRCQFPKGAWSSLTRSPYWSSSFLAAICVEVGHDIPSCIGARTGRSVIAACIMSAALPTA
jgi:hypothetical protein